MPNKAVDLQFYLPSQALPVSVTFPSGDWTVREMSIQLTTSAVVGNRQLVITVSDAADVELAHTDSYQVQAGSKNILHLFVEDAAANAAVTDKSKLTTIADPITLSTANPKLTISDSAAIDAAGDRVTVMVEAVRS